MAAQRRTYGPTNRAGTRMGRDFRVYGSAAPQLDARYGSVAPEIQREAAANPAPELHVIEGRGLDARVQRGVSDSFIMALVIGFAGVVGVFLVFFLSISLTAGCVQSLNEVATLKAEIAQAQDQSRSLSVEGAVLSNPTRINDIATQNYNMIYTDPSHADSIQISLE